MSDLQLKSIIERILRLHAEEDEIKADRREIYAEAKSNGYDKTALGAAVSIIRKREKDAAGFEERNAIVDLYLSAFDGSSHVHAPARTREAAEPRSSREVRPVAQEADHVDRGASAQSHSAEGGPAHLSKAGEAGTGQASGTETDIQIGQPSGAGTGSAVRAGAPVSNTSPDLSPAAQNEGAAGASPGQEASDRADGGGLIYPAQDAEFVTQAGAGEGVPALAEPAPAADAKPFARLARHQDCRPHCRKPDACGSASLDHCFICKQALAASEREAA
jgi:uncharacterized protein (UPF0335 family)